MVSLRRFLVPSLAFASVASFAGRASGVVVQGSPDSYAAATIVDSIIENNQGGIVNSAATTEIWNTIIRNNSIPFGDGAGIRNNDFNPSGNPDVSLVNV